jgi:4-carboxymuconolactone decarboxylase
MPRLPEVLDPNALPEDKRELFEYLARTRGSVRPPFSIVMNSPEAAERISHLGGYIRFESNLPKAATELATLVASRQYDCRHEWHMHTGFAREAGVSEAAIQAIGHRKSLEGLSDEEALPIRYSRELLEQHAVSDETFAAARQRYGDAGVIDLTAAVGYYCLMACILNALEVIPPSTAEQLPD